MAPLVAMNANLALMQWTGTGRQRVVITWKEMALNEDVASFANEIPQVPRLWRNYSTAIGEAIALSLVSFALVPECKRRVIDISGDGPSNEGIPPRDLRDQLADADVTVNALVIEETGEWLTAYFKNEVIAGPGAFSVKANGFEDYPAQIVRKLYRELTKAVSVLEE